MTRYLALIALTLITIGLRSAWAAPTLTVSPGTHTFTTSETSAALSSGEGTYIVKEFIVAWQDQTNSAGNVLTLYIRGTDANFTGGTRSGNKPCTEIQWKKTSDPDSAYQNLQHLTGNNYQTIATGLPDDSSLAVSLRVKTTMLDTGSGGTWTYSYNSKIDWKIQ